MSTGTKAIILALLLGAWMGIEELKAADAIDRARALDTDTDSCEVGEGN